MSAPHIDTASLALVPLIAISAITAFVLAAAWRNFGHVLHVLTWAWGFAALAVMWLAHLALPTGSGDARMACSLFGGIAVSLGAIGFRQRAQLADLARGLGAIAVAQIIATLLLIVGGAPPALLVIPSYIQYLIMLLICANTLQGRRHVERAAERSLRVAIAAAVIWIGIRLLQSIGIGDGMLAPLRPIADIAQPAIVMAAGMFAIFLMAADLADKMRRLAATDLLTGLLNRRGLDEALGAMLESARRNRQTIVLTLADVDRFKSINDQYGHASGDEVIRGFGACLAAGVARRDLVARIGGEEFAIVMIDTDDQAAVCAAEVLREQIARLRFGEGGLAITASFGVAACAGGKSTLQELMARADEALYQAKAAGRNRVTLAV